MNRRRSRPQRKLRPQEPAAHPLPARQDSGGKTPNGATLETTLTVNGTPITRRIPARQHLIDFLREELGLTGSHVGCEHGVCGTCTVRVDGKIVRGCLMLAVQADGRRVDTIEGLSDSGELAALQEAFHRRNALQCGFCTPGMLIAAQDLVANEPGASRERDPRAPLGQLLPLHRLPGDRGRDRGRARRAAQET